jgi:hypothetical protein
MCDYVFLDGDGMKYNPFGPAGETVEGSRRIRQILGGRKLSTEFPTDNMLYWPKILFPFRSIFCSSELSLTGIIVLMCCAPTRSYPTYRG